MTLDQFVPLTINLYRGAKIEHELSPERMDALWKQYGFHPVEVWAMAVDRLLCDPLWPTTQRIDTALEYCEEAAERERLRLARESVGAGGIAGVVQHAASRTETSDDIRALQRRVSDCIFAGGKPRDVIEVLSAARLEHDDCGNWIRTLEESPDDWRGVPIRPVGGSYFTPKRRELFG